MAELEKRRKKKRSKKTKKSVKPSTRIPDKNEQIIMNLIRQGVGMGNAPAGGVAIQNSIQSQLINSLREDLTRGLNALKMQQDKNADILQQTRQDVNTAIANDRSKTPMEQQGLMITNTGTQPDEDATVGREVDADPDRFKVVELDDSGTQTDKQKRGSYKKQLTNQEFLKEAEKFVGRPKRSKKP